MTSEVSARDTFRIWAKSALWPLSAGEGSGYAIDLERFGAAIGDASIVALTEGVHGAAEPLEFRNRAFRYLVENKGFTAIAIESGAVEGRLVHDYVRGGPGDLSGVLARGISWSMDQLPQNRELIRWLRDHNARASSGATVNFYGFDVSGNQGDVPGNRGMDTALRTALEYLDHVDPSTGGRFHSRLDSLLPTVRFDLNRSKDSVGYDTLTSAQRDSLTSGIADLVSLFERCEAQYSGLSNTTDYQWAMRAAISARQIDAWLRCVPIDWQPLGEPFTSFPNEQIGFFSVAHDVRDRAQADNLEWIIEQEGAAGKILLFAHRFHLSASPVDANGWFSRRPGTIPQQPAGTYLSRRHGRKVITIGNFIAAGNLHCAEFRHTLPRAPQDSLDGLFSELGCSQFLLDLRQAPVSTRRWLDQQHLLGQDPLRLAPGSAYDVVLFFDTVSPAAN